ncbi:MAG: hypothetical protein ACREML_08495 [Vulcanimicrobiaceae bacterium]
MQSPPQNVESTFGRSWELLKNNGVIIIPGLIIGFVLGVIDYFIAPHTEYIAGYGVTSWWAAASASILLVLVNLAGFILAQCYITGMAGAAWQRGTATFADGTHAFERDASNVFIALIGLFIALIIAAILALPTIGISALLYFYFFIYTFPAAIIGERPGFAAMGDSFRIAARRVAPTLIVTIMITVILWVGHLIGAVLHFIPLVGPIVAAIIIQLVLAYVTLVVVGEYLALRDSLGKPPTAA